jgi:hypothetical protein
MGPTAGQDAVEKRKNYFSTAILTPNFWSPKPSHYIN